MSKTTRRNNLNPRYLGSKSLLQYKCPQLAYLTRILNLPPLHELKAPNNTLVKHKTTIKKKLKKEQRKYELTGMVLSNKRKIVTFYLINKISP